MLRGLGSAQAEPYDKWRALCGENRYSTTLHVLNSAIVKLGKLTRVERVYRGIAGGLLPDSWKVENEFGVRGGVEPAFMSTSLNKAQAAFYARGGADKSKANAPAVLFENFCCSHFIT